MNKLKDILVTTLLSYNIDIDHVYLYLSEESRLEHLAYVSNDKNLIIYMYNHHMLLLEKR